MHLALFVNRIFIAVSQKARRTTPVAQYLYLRAAFRAAQGGMLESLQDLDAIWKMEPMLFPRKWAS